MSNTVVTIHLNGSSRPTRIQFDDAGNIQTTGGDRVLQGDQLIGLTKDVTPTLGHGPMSPPESFDPENWVGADELVSEGAADLELAGWFPVFRTENREWIYTWSAPVTRVEVTVR